MLVHNIATKELLIKNVIRNINLNFTNDYSNFIIATKIIMKFGDTKLVMIFSVNKTCLLICYILEEELLIKECLIV